MVRRYPSVQDTANDHIVGFSRDGLHLIFSSDRNGKFGIWSFAFYRNAVEGSPTVLADDLGRASVLGMAHNGAFYYTKSTNSLDVYTAEIDVASGRLLSSPSNVVKRFRGSFQFPTWSADGSQLSFVSKLEVGWEIWIYSRQSGEMRRLEPKLASFIRPQWDPSGNGIFVSGNDRSGRSGIFLVDVQTGDAKLVIDKRTLRGQEGTWGKDGRTLYDRFTNALKGLFRIDTQTHQRQVLYVPPENLDLGTENLALSPDENTLAFKVTDRKAGTSSLMLIPAEGGPARSLLTITKPEEFPFGSFAWSADSKQILTVRTRDQSSELWLVPTEGGDARKVDFPAMSVRQMRMSSDGRTIAFTSGVASGEVWVAENILPR